MHSRFPFLAAVLVALLAFAPTSFSQDADTLPLKPAVVGSAPDALGPLGTFASGLGRTQGLAELSDGRVLIGQRDGLAVQAYDQSGTPLGTFATFTSGVVAGVHQLADGRVLVANSSTVEAFDLNGTSLGSFATGFDYAWHIHQLTDGRILVSDRSSRVVQAYEPNGTSLGTFGSGYESNPAGILELPNGNVLVSESEVGQLKEFAPDGTPLGTFASIAGYPYDATLLNDGTVLMTTFSPTVEQVAADGTPLGTFASGMASTYGVLQLADGRVLVATGGNVEAFEGPAPSGPDVTIAVTSYSNSPVRGESVFFRGPVTNDGTTETFVYVYATVDIPGGIVFKRNLGGVTLDPGETFQYKNFPRSKNYIPLPFESPDGVYTVTVYAASDRNGTTIYDSDSFSFTLGPVCATTCADETLPMGATANLETTAPSARPNPFRDVTEITYAMAEAADMDLRVYDALGREVALLASGRQSAGTHAATFAADDLPGGVYVWRLRIGGEVTTGRITLAR